MLTPWRKNYEGVLVVEQERREHRDEMLRLEKQSSGGGRRALCHLLLSIRSRNSAGPSATGGTTQATNTGGGAICDPYATILPDMSRWMSRKIT